MKGLTIERVIYLFQKHNPTTIQEIKDLGIPVYYLARGAFRIVYKIKKVPLVIKLTKNKPELYHTREEYNIVKKIRSSKRKYKDLSHYVPEILYFNYKTGVMIMKYYKPMHHTKYKNLSNTIAALLTDLFGLAWKVKYSKYGLDIHGSNIGIDNPDSVVILDLGYFSEKGKGYS